MSFKLAGNTGNLAEVNTFGALNMVLEDTSGNSLTKTQRLKIPSTQEGVMVMGKSDDYATFIRTDKKGNLITGNYQPILSEPFEGAIVNISKWVATSVTFAPTQATVGGYQHNPGASVAISTGTMLVSSTLAKKNQRTPLYIRRRWRHSMVSNSISDFGFGTPTALTTLIVPNGAQFRCTSSGVIQALLTYNGTEIGISNVIARSTLGGNTIGAALTMTSLGTNYYSWDIICDDDNAVFIIQDTETGDMLGSVSIPVPAVIQKMWGSTGLPYYERTYNLATAPASAPVVITTDVIVYNTDINTQLSAASSAGRLHRGASRNPFSGAQLANHSNSVAPVSATLSNTAVGYGTLGGKFQFAAVAGAITDYALFGFTVPVGSTFYCTGVRISTRNTGAAVAVSATTLEWTLGLNSSIVSLASTNIARTQVGNQVFPIGAAIEAVATDIDFQFQAEEAIESGRFLHLILNMPVGTATVGQIIRGQVSFYGYFE